ncbi:MAG TPA: LysM peptidoglycan-binding domain-containing protein, partial [Nitrolancea sp.]|nr:LysM peptidoglycan-binding domain-containing protein [Nitrolancea sp.]
MIIEARGWRRVGTILATAALVWTTSLLPAAADSHVVAPGETLSGIAAAYGVPLDVLAAQNHIVNVNLIFAGESLTVPGQAPPAGPPTADIYVVQSGDSLSSIAAAEGTTVQQLLAANADIVDANTIYIGESLVIPGATGTPASVETAYEPESSGDVPTLLTEYAEEYGLDPILVEALAWQES